MSQMDSTYKIIRKLGAGGGGDVYLAEHLRLNKRVVLKADKRKLTTNWDLLRREVDILKELSHPHIPRVYDFFVENDTIYTAMDYIEGESLDKVLKRGESFSQAQILRFADQLLDALAYLHNPVHGNPPKGYVHSDIKPANLMRSPQGDIYLIDFNVAGALGEKSAIGFSAGYASPEHYGLDFSSRYEEEGEFTLTLPAEENGELTLTLQTEEEAGLMTPSKKDRVAAADTATLTMVGDAPESVSSHPSGYAGYYHSASPSKRKAVTPDIRSDIYSVGATLYHLLSGKRPEKNAKEVVMLSKERFNPLIVDIISKAMNPNRDLRYQTAQEMRKDFWNLRDNDPRMRRWRRRRRIAAILFPTFFLMGGGLAFTGLKRIQMMENWLKRTEYSQTALDRGDVRGAAEESRRVICESQGQFLPKQVPGIQKVLTEALGVYDLSDGYKLFRTLELPAAPLYLAVSPDGSNGAALCGQTVAVFDTKRAEIIAELPAGRSTISQLCYRDKDTLLFAGKDGVTAYHVREGRKLWTGKPATSISISADGRRVACICEGESFATVYDGETGEVVYKVDFEGRRQNIGVKDNLFALNQDGSLLSVSFKDGSLEIFDLEHPEKETMVLRQDSGYIHFEGGFSGKYLAFLAADKEESMFAVIDTEKGEEAGGFQSETAFGLQADEDGIFVQSENILVKLDPATGEQTPTVAMEEGILSFAVNGTDTAVTSKDAILFFDGNARQTARYKKEYQSDLVCLAKGTAVFASMDKPELRIMKYEENSQAERFSYDKDYEHREARISADEETVMLFSYQYFRIYDREGGLVTEMPLPDSDHVVDQQFIREDNVSCLEVTYDNGRIYVYSAKDGSLIKEEWEGQSIKDLDEEFLVEGLRIESPLHGTPVAYDAKTGKKLASLAKDAYLTYVEKAKDYLVAQYVTAEGYGFGQLLDKNCQVLAELPYLCDVKGEKLIFDYPAGSIRESEIYDLEELVEMAKQ